MKKNYHILDDIQNNLPDRIKYDSMLNQSQIKCISNKWKYKKKILNILYISMKYTQFVDTKC